MAIPGIQEIQALATKYSKPQLQKMAQMGLVDPTKAVMAGMMIDRIQKQNMQPPQQTVAEEVMGGPPPMPEGAPPPEQAPPAGIAGLPSGLPPQMAGGGIVAFADGGDTEEYADGGVVGYKDEGLVRDAGITGVIDPNWASSKSFKRNYSSDDKFAILAEQLAQLTAAERQAQGVDKIRIQKDMDELRATMRSLKASPRAKSLVDEIPISAAGAAEPSSLPPISSPKSGERLKTPRERLMEEQVREDIGYTDKPISPELQRASEESAKRATERQKAQQELRDLEGGFFSQRSMTEEEAARAKALRQQIEGASKPVPVAAPESAKKFEVTPVEPKPKATAEEKEPEIKMPELPQAVQLDVPEKPEFTDQFNKVKEAYKQAGVDVDLYKEMRNELKEKKATGAQKRDLALGHAMMAFGFDLFGARQGEVASRISSAGQKSLYQYMSNMDKITENEEKLDALDRQIRLSENQFRMTGADSAMRRMEKLEDKRTSILEKNAELAYDANKSRATIAADLFRTNKTFEANMNAAAARLASALGANRGGFTDQQLVNLRAQMEIQYAPTLRELYKDRGSKEQIEKIVSEKIDQKVLEEVNKARGIRASGNIPVPQSSSGWSVSGGVD